MDTIPNVRSVSSRTAEWTLDTLDAMFGFYFIEPAKTAARKAALAAQTGP